MCFKGQYTHKFAHAHNQYQPNNQTHNSVSTSLYTACNAPKGTLTHMNMCNALKLSHTHANANEQEWKRKKVNSKGNNNSHEFNVKKKYCVKRQHTHTVFELPKDNHKNIIVNWQLLCGSTLTHIHTNTHTCISHRNQLFRSHQYEMSVTK